MKLPCAFLFVPFLSFILFFVVLRSVLTLNRRESPLP